MNTQQVSLTTTEKEQITQQAVALFNTVFTDWIIVERSGKQCLDKSQIDKNEGRSMNPDDLKVTNVTKAGKAGHLGINNTYEYWKLGVNVRRYDAGWQGACWLEFLLHELSHIPAPNHSPDFWEVQAEAINNTVEKQEAVEEVIGCEVRMDRVRERACESIYTSGGVEDVKEQLDAFTEVIDYDEKYVGAFDTRICFSESAVSKSDKRVPHTELRVSEQRRDWVLYDMLDKYSPTGYRCGEVVEFDRPIIVTENLEVVDAREREADLINRITERQPGYTVDVPVKFQ